MDPGRALSDLVAVGLLFERFLAASVCNQLLLSSSYGRNDSVTFGV